MLACSFLAWTASCLPKRKLGGDENASSCPCPHNPCKVQKPRVVKPFVWNLREMGSSKLTAIMQKSLDLEFLQQELKARKTKRGNASLRQQIKLAKLSKRFWLLSFQQRNELLAEAGVYIFQDSQEELGPAEIDLQNRPGPHRQPKRAIATKTPPKDVLWPGWSACIASGLRSSRGSRELGADVFSVKWGRKAHKPLALWRWSSIGSEQPPFLRFLCMKDADKGQCLYSAEPLDKSPTACQLQQHCSMHKLFNRLPLLFSPSQTTLTLPAHAITEIVTDIAVSVQVDGDVSEVQLSDGVCEIGPDLAEELCLFDKSRPDTDRQRLLYAAQQFRGVLQVGDLMVLAKGMLLVNGDLGNKLRLRRSCVKAEWPADPAANIQLGLDIVQDTSKPQCAPKLHAQVLSALAMRTRRQKRREAKAELREFCAERQAGLLDAMEASAWDLPRHEPAPSLPHKLERIAPSNKPVIGTQRSLRTTPQNHIDVVYQEERIADPAPLDMLRMAEEIERPWALRTHRTKDALLRGGRRFRAEAQQQQSNPRLPLKGFGAGCFALPDLQQRLPARECHVIVDGKVLTGPVAVGKLALYHLQQTCASCPTTASSAVVVAWG